MKLSGFDSLLGKLSRMDADIPGASLKAIQRAGRIIEASAKENCPEVTSNLRERIELQTGDTGSSVIASVGTNVEYAAYVEFGTGQAGEASSKPSVDGYSSLPFEGEPSYRHDWSGQPAQPYLYPALKQNEDAVRETIGRVLQEETSRAEG